MLKRKNPLSTLRKSVLAIFTYSILFTACGKKEIQSLDKKTIATIQNDAATDEISRLRTFLAQAYRTEDTNIIYSDSSSEFIIDGDMIMPLEHARGHYAKKLEALNNGEIGIYQSLFYDGLIVSRQNAPNIKYYINSDVPTAWRIAIAEAVNAWNTTDCILRLQETTIATETDITFKIRNNPNSDVIADADVPTPVGKPGQAIRINDTFGNSITAEQMRIALCHELGHTFGFDHTGGAGTLPIPGTPDLDPLSIMKPRVTSDDVWTGFSYWDMVAIGKIYPNKEGTVRFLRYYNAKSGDHLYTTNPDEVGSGAGVYTFEWNAQIAYIYPISAIVNNTVRLYRYYNSSKGDRFYTTDFSLLGSGKDGYVFEKSEGWVYNTQSVSGLRPLYQYWDATHGLHFYTTNFNELGSGSGPYVYTQITCYVF